MQISDFVSSDFLSCVEPSRPTSFETVLRASFPSLEKLAFKVQHGLSSQLAEQFKAFIKWVFPVTTATESVQVLLQFDLIISPEEMKERYEVDMKSVDVDVQAYISKAFEEGLITYKYY